MHMHSTLSFRFTILILATAHADDGTSPGRYVPDKGWVGRKPVAVTFGTPRTATTLSTFIVRAFLCATNMAGDVYKTHDLEEAKSLAREGIPLFVTHRESKYNTWGESSDCDGDATARSLEKEWGIPRNSIKVLQRTASVAQREWRVVQDYAAFFKAPPLRRDGRDAERRRRAAHAMWAVVEFIRPWSTLRRCCGSLPESRC